MKSLNTLLGLKGRFDLAMESEEELANATSISDTSVVLTGPLADAYTSALDQVFAKDAEGTGTVGDPSAVVEPTGETGMNVDGEVAPQPGQVIEPDEEGKTNEVVPAEGDVASVGSTGTPENADDVPLNQEAPIEGEGTSEEAPAEVDAETQEEIKAIVLESQAQDAILLQSLHSSIVPEEPSDENFETVYAVDETKVDADDVIQVTELLKNAEDPETVTVLIDSEVAASSNVTPPECNGDSRPLTPEGDVPEKTESSEEGEESKDDTKEEEEKPEPSPLAASLESIVISMGGKVVHSFAEYVATRRR